MRDEKKYIKSVYKNAYSKINAPEELKKRLMDIPSARGRKHKAVLLKITLIAAAVLICFVLSNLATWAATGRPWVVTVSDSMYKRELNKAMEEHSVYTIGATWEAVDVDETQESTTIDEEAD